MRSKTTLRNAGICLFVIFNSLLASCSSSRQAIVSIENYQAFNQGFVGIAVFDPVKNKMIYEYNAEKYFTPASNTKLFTFYAGLKMLRDSVPALRYQIKNDSLIFSGTGDPSFLYSDLPDSGIYEFLKSRSETLYYLPPSYVESTFGPGWAWDWYDANYATERTDFPIYGNRVSFQFLKGTETPLVTPDIFSDSLSISETTFSSRIGRERYKNIFKYNNLEKEKDFRQNVPITYSPALVAKLLSDTLGKEVKLLKEAPSEYSLDRTLYSIPTDSILKRMLVVSDNFIAEQILLMTSNEISDSLRSSNAINFMKENYLQDLPDEPMWYDGSGLSVNNKFTPRSIVKLLEKILQEVPQDKLLGMLPTGGVSGTIRNDYKADEPYVFAKTGTLRNVVALSGYLKTKSGKILIFSFLHNNYVIPSSEIKKGMEKILINVRDNY
ncbi:D-alanyl-D-alanine carboxypeptidase/D-alanyl-D-alanine-endopeptidase [soil metagenome]